MSDLKISICCENGVATYFFKEEGPLAISKLKSGSSRAQDLNAKQPNHEVRKSGVGKRMKNNDLLRRSMENVLIDVSQMPDGEKLTGFSVMKGDSYNGDLMVVGRAVNGWSTQFNASDLKETGRRDIVLNGILDSSQNKDHCPMLWVTEPPKTVKDYNANRSPFWRSIRNVIRKLDLASVEDNSWPSSVVWSNLYKISPFEGGNPSSDLCKIQLSSCINLLNAEIEMFKPRRVLFMTGFSWCCPFLGSLSKVVFSDDLENYVSLRGIQEKEDHQTQRHIVVAEHPQTRNETTWVNQVKNSFDLLAAL